jgi:serine/threonine protein kinase/tetratricopeptide (TPR) repeat protein
VEPFDKDRTTFLPLAQHGETLRREFMAAWEAALAGEPPPRIDAYLARAPEAERTALEEELQRIERDFQKHSLPGTEVISPTACLPPGPPEVQQSIPEATLTGDSRGPGRPSSSRDFDFELSPSVQDQTVEHDSAEISRMATVEFSSPDGSPAGPAEPGVAPDSSFVAGYEIMGVLGRGGMGVVYKARQAKLNRLVALKMVLAGAHAGAHQLARFYTEAEAVARLQHPNIVQIYEVGELDGLPFFSLEYLNGGSLSKKIAGKPQPPREAAATLELLAQAMAVAHEHGIIHRDLKPANVLLTKDGVPKITDFGLAKRLEDDSSQTKSGTLMGTPSYMSPEQARGETHEIGPLADLYSLGAILYELLTGRPPFVGTTMLETLFQVRNQEPVPPTRLQPKCPRDLETICLKCLQKEAGKRYPNCTALADDLHRFLAGESIKARPTGRLERAWRWCRRNPRVAALSTMVGVLLLLLAVSLVGMAVRRSRDQAALAETRTVAGERLAQASEAIAGGNHARARDLLQWSDPLLSSRPELADVRGELETLRAQVDVYAEFRQLLDSARFACRFGSRRLKEEGRRSCHELLTLYDEIEQRTGRGTAGLPPLDALQQQLFKEDVFEAFLTAAQVEQEVTKGSGDAAERQAAQQALDWLNRAEEVLPGTRALRVHRAPCWARLGKTEAERADMEQAKTIQPTSAVDRFWHGFANHLRGDEALRKRDFKAAHGFYRDEIAEYAAFLRLRPDHFWGYFNWANCHMQLNERPDLYDAIIGFTACMRLQRDFPWPYNNRGTAHLRLEQYDLALADFDAALARNEHYPEAHANRGLVNVKLGRQDAALADFTRAIELNPDYTQARANRIDLLLGRGRYAEARTDLSRILEAAPAAAPIWRARAIVNWQNLKDFDAALTDFEKFARLQQKDAEPHRCTGAILLSRRRYGPALVALQKALDLRPGYPEALWARAQIYLWQGKAEQALKELDPLVAKLPDGPPETLNVRAAIYQALDRPKEAEEDYRRLIALKPKGPEAYRSLAEAHVGLARILEKRDEKALAAECFDGLVAATPESEWAYLRRAEYRRDQGKYDDALADCDRAARLKPGWAVPALVRASVEVARGQPAAGVAEAERALEKAPKNDGQVLLAAACVWSLAARAATDPGEVKRHTDRAAGLLAEALDRGFPDLIYPEVNRLADDPALAPIRDDPRVRALLSRKEEG